MSSIARRHVIARAYPRSPSIFRYVKVYEASLFALAVQRPDGLLNHEEVVKQLTDLTVSYDAGLGIRGDFPEVMTVVLKVEKHQYQNAIAWYAVLIPSFVSSAHVNNPLSPCRLRDLLSKSVFDKER